MLTHVCVLGGCVCVCVCVGGGGRGVTHAPECICGGRGGIPAKYHVADFCFRASISLPHGTCILHGSSSRPIHFAILPHRPPPHRAPADPPRTHRPTAPASPTALAQSYRARPVLLRPPSPTAPAQSYRAPPTHHAGRRPNAPPADPPRSPPTHHAAQPTHGAARRPTAPPVGLPRAPSLCVPMSILLGSQSSPRSIATATPDGMSCRNRCVAYKPLCAL